MAWFRRLSGPAVDVLQAMRRAPAFRRARVDVASRGKRLQRLVIGIGQMHPVLTGRFTNRQGRQIARVQSDIFNLCSSMRRMWGVRRFGQEGFSIDGGGILHARLGTALLHRCREEFDEHGSEDRFLRKVAQEWIDALGRGDGEAAAQAVVALNALTLLQALDGAVTMFPIEQKGVHAVIGENVALLQQHIADIERSPAFVACRRKGGKGLTRGEYEAAKMRERLIGEYNAMLTHPERERSILREVLEHAEGENITVFILGSAHRTQMLRTVRQYVPDDVLFLWITPPSLRWRGFSLWHY